MKLLKFVIFLSSLASIFILVYRNSDNKGLRRLRISFRTAIVIASSLASLSSKGAEATEFSVSNSQVVHERLVSNQEFNSLEENDRQVILVKTDGNLITPPTRLTSPTRKAWISPSPFPPRSGTGINPYRTPSKFVDQRLGARRNPAGARGNPAGAGGNPAGAGGNAEFTDKTNSPVPKKEQSQKLKTSDYLLNSQKPDEQCELDKNVEKIEIVDKIKESPGLRREAEKIIKDQAAQRDINHLIEQLSLNNKNPGKRNRKVQGLKNVTEARGKNGGRVYFRERDGKIEIIGKSNKKNQDKVLILLERMGY
jgi:hypothetical protein